MFKKILKKVLITFCLLCIPISVLAWGTLVLQSWDCVDSGKHMDYKNNSSYAVKDGIAVWNKYKSGVIRPDSANTVNDVTYSDVESLGGDTAGRTSSNGTIKFSKQYMKNYNKKQRLNVIIHETGHALRLGHRDEIDSVMQKNVSEVTELSSGDKRNYDWAYDNYY